MKCVRINCGKELPKNKSITNGMYLCESHKEEDKKAHEQNAKVMADFTKKFYKRFGTE